MSVRNVFRFLLSGLLLVLATGSVLAGVPQSTKPFLSVSSTSKSAANAPWFNTEIDTPNDTGQHTSVAIDKSNGGIFVSYYDATYQELRLARSNGLGYDCDPKTDWGCLTLDSGPDVGLHNSIAVNQADGGVGISYHDATNGKLKYIYMENPHLNVWSIYTIDKGIEGVSTTGLHTSLKYNSNEQPIIAYYFDNPSGVDALMLAYYSYASGNCAYADYMEQWRCETIITGEGLGQYASLFVVDGWDFHIAFYDGYNGDLWYATSVGDGNCGPYGTDWVCYPISGTSVDVGKYASLYVDDAGHFHIAYYDATNDKLKYAYELDSSMGNCGILGSAQCDTIDPMPADYHPLGISIAEDAAGYPIIAYQSEYGSLNVARPVAALGWPAGSGNCGPETPFASWHCQTIDPAGTWIYYRNADYASIAVNASGLATIAYYGFILPEGGNLYVSQQLLQYFLPFVMNDH